MSKFANQSCKPMSSRYLNVTRGSGGLNSCDALLERVEQNDPKLTELTILSMKVFGDKECARLSAALPSNVHLRSLSASGHAISAAALRTLGLAISNSALTSLAIGSCDTGDDGICFLCDGLAAGSTLESIDLSYKGM